MTTHDALLSAVLAAPDDDLPRLVLADHYEGELGQPERAAWIRIQCELERTMPDRRPWYVPGNWPDKTRPNSRQNLERHIWAKAVESEQVFDWFKVFAHNSVSEVGVGFIWGDDQMSDTDDDDGTECPRATIRRGFVSEVRCTLADWCGPRCVCRTAGGPWANSSCCKGTGFRTGIGPQIVRRHPVERVELADAVIVSAVQGSPFGTVTQRSAGPLFDIAFPRAFSGQVEGVAEVLGRHVSAAAIAWAKSQPTHAVYHGDGQTYRVVATGL